MVDEEQTEKIKEQLISRLSRLPEEQTSALKEKIEGMNPKEIENFIAQQNQHINKSGKRQCLFCQIIKGLVETTRIYEDEKVLAILDIMPANIGQTIVMPKQHSQFLFQLPEEVLVHLMKITSLLEEIVVNTTKSTGVNICISQGQSAEQTVPHISINLIPRKEGDKFSLSWPRNKIGSKELEKIAKDMSSRILKDLEIKWKDKHEMPEKKVRKRKVDKAIKKEKSEVEKILEHIGKRLP